MPYRPPTPTNWPRVGQCSPAYTAEYDAGWFAARYGLNEDDNPHEESGHERDTTFTDNLHYYWYRGFNDYISSIRELST